MGEELKISCQYCNGHIEFPREYLGQTIACPHCSNQIVLTELIKDIERWNYYDGKKFFGPYTTEQIKILLFSESISSSTIVTREGYEERLQISSLPEFAEFNQKGKTSKLDVNKWIRLVSSKASSFGISRKRVLAGGCIAILTLGLAGWYWGFHVPAIKKQLEALTTPKLGNPDVSIKNTSKEENEATKAQFNYFTNDGTITITGYTGSGDAVTIPSTIDGLPVTSMDHAFYFNTNLTSIIIPDSVISIGDGTFWECHSLNSITIPNNVTSIGEFAFCDCFSLSSVIIPNSVTSIWNAAFYGCTNLTGVTIGNSVTTIGKGAFRECNSLTSVKIPESVKSIGKKAFMGCNMIEAITVDPLNSSYSSIAGVLFNKNQTILIQYPERKNGSSYTIPETVTSIEDCAFQCSKLTSVTIPKNVNNIGNATFDACTDLMGVYFKGDAPSAGDVFLGDNKATVYYLSGTKGWGTTFAWLPTSVWNQ